MSTSEIGMSQTALIDLSLACEETAIAHGLAAAQQMAATATDAATITTTLRQGKPLARSRGLYLLFLLPCEDSTAALRDVLSNDEDEVVRHEAAYYLGALRLERVIDDLVRSVISDTSTLVRHEAAEALGEIPSSRALAALRELVRSDDATVSRTASIAIDGVNARLRLGVLAGELGRAEHPQQPTGRASA